MTNALLVNCHPRQNSLTHAVAQTFCEHAKGVTFEIADLYAEGFDPCMGVEDEPDWEDPRKAYSVAVQKEMQRVERNSATVMVFPVWWWSMPAMLKGWIDRVFNHGWAYGDRTYPQKTVWMIAVAGNDQPSYVKRGYDIALETQLKVGILDYCGVASPRLEVLYGAIEGEEYVSNILKRAAVLGEEFQSVL